MALIEKAPIIAMFVFVFAIVMGMPAVEAQRDDKWKTLLPPTLPLKVQ